MIFSTLCLLCFVSFDVTVYQQAIISHFIFLESFFFLVTLEILYIYI